MCNLGSQIFFTILLDLICLSTLFLCLGGLDVDKFLLFVRFLLGLTVKRFERFGCGALISN